MNHRFDAGKYLLAGLEANAAQWRNMCTMLGILQKVETGFDREERRVYRCDFGKGFQVEDGEEVGVSFTMTLNKDGSIHMEGAEPYKVIEMAQAPDGTWQAKDQGDHPDAGGGYRLPAPGSVVFHGPGREPEPGD